MCKLNLTNINACVQFTKVLLCAYTQSMDHGWWFTTFGLRHYPYRFGLRVLRILPKLQADGPRVFPAPPADFDPLQCFMSHEFTDMWEDADIPQALWYIRGNRSLNVPAEWKPHFFPSMDCFDFSEGQA